MLTDLHIHNYALISRVELSFGPGLNILTGETGAGKSILIDAVATVLGGRALAEAVRFGEEEAVVEACFALGPDAPAVQRAAEMGVPVEDGTLILRRDIARNGRHKARLCGMLVTAGQLAEIGAELVDIHGQHEHQSLLRPSRQLALLDAYGGPTLAELRARAERLYREVAATREEMRQLEEGAREAARRLDFLRFQLSEIEAARLRPGEDVELEQERRILQHAERLLRQTSEAYEALYEGGGERVAATDLLASASGALAEACGLDERLRPVAAAVEAVNVQVQEAAHELRRYRDSVSLDPARLAEVEERLAAIAALRRKYGSSVEEILATARSIGREIEQLAGRDERRGQVAAALAAATARLAEEAAVLSRARQAAAEKLAEAMGEALGGLNLGEVHFAVRLYQEDDPAGVPVGGRSLAVSAGGVDRAEFLFSANPGEPPRPLARIASGGELSRVMLALKCVLSRVDPVPTLIFDEVDAGIGGRTAQAVADRLGELGQSRQVLCVTHLPQIASRAARHFTIEKRVAQGAAGERTQVAAARVEGEARVHELARMLGGSPTPATLAHARELLDTTGAATA